MITCQPQHVYGNYSQCFDTTFSSRHYCFVLLGYDQMQSVAQLCLLLLHCLQRGLLLVEHNIKLATFLLLFFLFYLNFFLTECHFFVTFLFQTIFFLHHTFILLPAFPFLCLSLPFHGLFSHFLCGSFILLFLSTVLASTLFSSLPEVPLRTTINFILQTVLIILIHFHTVNMKRLKCEHCTIPGCGSKFLVRLANHLAKVHELSEIERKYWLQFTKLQNTNMVRVYEKDSQPKTIFE